MKFIKLFTVFFLSLLIVFLFFNYKQPPDKKNLFYLSLRKIVIQKIELVKKSDIFKEYLFFRGKKFIKNNFSEKIFYKYKNLLEKEYILNKNQIEINEISFDQLANKLKSNLDKINNKSNSHVTRLKTNSNFNKSKPTGNHIIYRATYENIETNGILELKNKKKLIIYNQGHLGNPYNKDYYLKTKIYFQEKGYDFFTLSMLGLGFNYQGEVKFPNTTKKLNLDTYDHENIKFYLNEDYNIKKPLSLFLSGNYYLIKHVLEKNEYDEIIFLGVSGGGWYGLFLSSLITEISDTFVFNGNVPLYLTNFIDTKGDWEITKSNIYKRINYWDLYKMIYKNPENTNKKLYLIYNTKDKCCYRDPSATVMKKFEKKINNNRFLVKLYEREKFHGLDLVTFLKIYSEKK